MMKLIRFVLKLRRIAHLLHAFEVGMVPMPCALSNRASPSHIEETCTPDPDRLLNYKVYRYAGGRSEDTAWKDSKVMAVLNYLTLLNLLL
eukprot:3004248-Amphidinium_carterae.2